MQMKHRTAVLLVSQLMCVVLFGLWSFSATAAASSCPDNAQAYWKMFRIDALQGKSAKVANATRFPFAINGTLDEGEKRLIDREPARNLHHNQVATDWLHRLCLLTIGRMRCFG